MLAADCQVPLRGWKETYIRPVSPAQVSAESLRLPLEINEYFEILRKIPEVLQNVGKAKCLGNLLKKKEAGEMLVYLTMQAASHTYWSFSKVIFPDNNSDVTVLFAPLAFNFQLFPLCEFFIRRRSLGYEKLLYGFLQEERKSFGKHWDTWREFNFLTIIPM